MDKEIAKPNRSRLNPELSVALSAAVALSTATGAAAQEQDPAVSPEPTAEPNPLAEYCDTPASIKSDSQVLSNGETVVFESPTPTDSVEDLSTDTNETDPTEETNVKEDDKQEISAFQRITNSLNQKSYPDCDLENVSSHINSYIEENAEKIGIDEKTVKEYTGLINSSNAELNKKPEKRDVYQVSQGFLVMLETYANTGDEKVIELTEAYVAATMPNLPKKEYKNFIQQYLEGYKKRIKDAEAESKIQEQNTSVETSTDITEDTVTNNDEDNKTESKPVDVHEQMESLTQGKHEKKSVTKLGDKVYKTLKADEETLEALPSEEWFSFDLKFTKKQLDVCTGDKKAQDKTDRILKCASVLGNLVYAYANTKDQKYYELAKNWTDAIYTLNPNEKQQKLVENEISTIMSFIPKE